MTNYKLLDHAPILRSGDLETADLETLGRAEVTAWDIETSGLDFRQERIGTVQIADEERRTWIVQIDDERRPEVLCSLLASSAQRKVFHFAPFDLGFMRHQWGVRAQNVACTKVLDRLVEPKLKSHSLKEILWRELHVEIPKDESVRRSDWNAVALSPEQLRYATLDVAYLLPLFDQLMERAIRQGVSRLAQQSFEYLPVRVETEMLGIEDLFAY